MTTTSGNIDAWTTAGSGTSAKWTYKGGIKGAKGDKGETGTAGKDNTLFVQAIAKQIAREIEVLDIDMDGVVQLSIADTDLTNKLFIVNMTGNALCFTDCDRTRHWDACKSDGVTPWGTIQSGYSYIFELTADKLTAGETYLYDGRAIIYAQIASS